jgi:hypothetical protein
MIHGVLMTKSYVSQSSEVAGWGIYDIGATGTPLSNNTISTVKRPFFFGEFGGLSDGQ